MTKRVVTQSQTYGGGASLSYKVEEVTSPPLKTYGGGEIRTLGTD